MDQKADLFWISAMGNEIDNELLDELNHDNEIDNNELLDEFNQLEA